MRAAMRRFFGAFWWQVERQFDSFLALPGGGRPPDGAGGLKMNQADGWGIKNAVRYSAFNQTDTRTQRLAITCGAVLGSRSARRLVDLIEGCSHSLLPQGFLGLCIDGSCGRGLMAHLHLKNLDGHRLHSMGSIGVP